MSALIGLGHRKGVGKDTVGQILVSEHGFCRLAFADAIKASLCDLAPLLDPRLADAIGELGVCEAKASAPEVREALATLGTTMRRHAGPNVWVDGLARRIDGESNGRFVVTDVRAEREVRAIRGRGGLLVRVDRPGVAVGRDPADNALAGWDQWDAVVTNDGGLDGLAEQAAAIVAMAEGTERWAFQGVWVREGSP